MNATTATVTQDFRDFIIWERESHDTIDFKKIYVDMAADLKAGLMLSQIIYWRLPRKNCSDEDTRLTIDREGRKWLAKSDKDWWAEIRLTDKEARSARMVLEDRGIATFRTWKFAGCPTTHISINEDRFMELWHQMLETPLEERQAGRVEPRQKREKYRNPGSKPRSGNWRKNQPPEMAETVEDATGETPDESHETTLAEANGNYGKGNLEITERVKSKLPEGQNPNYEKGNLEITLSGTSYTESPAKTSSEKTSSSSKSAEINEASSWLPDDDDLAADAENKNPNPTSEATDHPVQVKTESQDAETQPSTDLEKVPGAAGGAAILALVPVPREVLEARTPRDPEQMKTLRALMQATNAKRLSHLHEQLALSTQGKVAVPRALLTRLTDEEIEQARKAAQTDAQIIPGGMSNAGYYALDAMIGERYTLARLKGERAELAPAQPPLGKAYEVKNSGRPAAPAEPQADTGTRTLAVGAMWRHRPTGELLLIREMPSVGKYVLSNGETVDAVFLTRFCTFEASPFAAEASA